MKRLRTAILAVAAIVFSHLPAQASILVRGTILAANGAPVDGAAIAVIDGPREVAHVSSDARGRFSTILAYDTETLVIAARGFVPVRLVVDGSEPLVVTLQPTQTQSRIARTVSRAGDATTVPGASASMNISQDAIARTGAQRIGDALAGVAGMSAVGQGSSVSDDLFLSLRGFKPSETQTLLDGHPLGPLGIFPDSNSGFDYQDAPFASLQQASVIYGTGPSPLLAFDSVDGSADLRTLEPTTLPATTFAQDLGSQRQSASSLRATGTIGSTRYAFAYGVRGTSGNFVPQTIAQTGLRSTDLTSATLRALTYDVSANADTRDALAKIRVPAGASTLVTFTATSATSWIDKTGVDDNDFYPAAFELQQAEANAGGSLLASGAHCPASLVPVIDDAHRLPQAPDCIAPRAFAVAASGPAGGGPGAFQAIRRSDEDLRIQSIRGPHTLSLEAFVDTDTTALVRPASYVQGSADATAVRAATFGYIARDDVAWGSTSVAFGASAFRQASRIDDSLGANAAAALAEQNAFANVTFAPNERLTVAAAALAKRLGAVQTSALDSQLLVTFRPANADAVRLVAGNAVAEPAALVRGGAPTFMAAGDLDPGNCSTFDIGSAPNGNVTVERAADLELSYGHRFPSNSAIAVDAYATRVAGQIFGAAAPLAGIAGFSAADPNLAGFYDRIRGICPGSYADATNARLFDVLEVEGPLNAAKALSRGIDVMGTLRLAPGLHLRASYSIDSTRRFDLPVAVLAVPSNVTIVDGGQVAGVPVHQGSATLGFSTPSGFSASIATRYQGPNNHYNLPGFAYADAALGAPLGRGGRIDIASSNVFGSHADTYGRVGLGLFVPENAFGTDRNALEAATERYGLTPATISVTFTQRVAAPSS